MSCDTFAPPILANTSSASSDGTYANSQTSHDTGKLQQFSYQLKSGGLLEKTSMPSYLRREVMSDASEAENGTATRGWESTGTTIVRSTSTQQGAYTQSSDETM